MDRDRSDAPTLREMQEYAWGYFELHANQRMSVFKFFVTLATFMVAGLSAAFVQGSQAVSVLFGLLLLVTSFVFCKLDERTRFLIKNSEGALRLLERQLFDVERLQLFEFEEHRTETLRSTKYRIRFWKNHLTYATCLGCSFWLFGSIGALGVVAAVVGTNPATREAGHQTSSHSLTANSPPGRAEPSMLDGATQEQGPSQNRARGTVAGTPSGGTSGR